jgi:hypothetical protein
VLRDLGDLTGTRTELERAIEIGEATARPPTTPQSPSTAISAISCSNWW